jgi:hypothetical protein
MVDKVTKTRLRGPYDVRRPLTDCDSGWYYVNKKSIDVYVHHGHGSGASAVRIPKDQLEQMLRLMERV